MPVQPSTSAVGSGLYRRADGTFWERPWIHGRRTWRKVEAPNLKRAREILAARRTDAARAAAGLARNPYTAGPDRVQSVLDAYRAAGCPNRRFEPRAGIQLYREEKRLDVLATWWGRRTLAEVRAPLCAEYFRARKAQITRGHGGRTVDLELAALTAALRYAVAQGLAPANPLAAQRPRFRPPTIRHCRESMPADADELHALARYFFETPGREVLGWQILLEAFTGCRTAEVMRLRWDARTRDHPGFQERGWLWLHRAKRGVNPYAFIHEPLRACLDALRAWCDRAHPLSPWYLPSPKYPGQPVGAGLLAHALPLAAPLVCGEGQRRTSHGLRAYYVTARRSQGISDAQVAAEIGDATGAAIIASTYGAIPANWAHHPGATALGWLPTEGTPAWESIPAAANILPMPQAPRSQTGL